MRRAAAGAVVLGDAAVSAALSASSSVGIAVNEDAGDAVLFLGGVNKGAGIVSRMLQIFHRLTLPPEKNHSGADPRSQDSARVRRLCLKARCYNYFLQE